MTVLAVCYCGCAFAAHRQQLGYMRQDFCDDHGGHHMRDEGWDEQEDVIAKLIGEAWGDRDDEPEVPEGENLVEQYPSFFEKLFGLAQEYDEEQDPALD